MWRVLFDDADLCRVRTQPSNPLGRARFEPRWGTRRSDAQRRRASAQTENMEFQGHSVRSLILRGGMPRSIRGFPTNLDSETLRVRTPSILRTGRTQIYCDWAIAAAANAALGVELLQRAGREAAGAAKRPSPKGAREPVNALVDFYGRSTNQESGFLRLRLRQILDV